MNTVCIHIDETLDIDSFNKLREDLMQVPHVSNVEMNLKVPHDLLVEFEEHHNTPVAILRALASRGLHSDIVSA